MNPSENVAHVRDLLLTGGLNPHHVAVAYRHAEEWVNTRPPVGGERGGSSSPTEIEERQEIVRVERLAERGLARIPELAKLLYDTAKELHDYTQRLTALDLTKVESDAWCVHHKTHGFSEPLGSRPRNGVCGWCQDFRRAEGVLPPKLVLEARARGERVTARLVASALGRQAS